MHERQRLIGNLTQLIAELRDTLPDPSQFRELLTAILAYLVQVSPGEKDQLSAAVRDSAYRPAEGAMMTIAEQWIAEGRQKGRVEGRVEGQVEGKQASLTRQLDRRFGLNSQERALIADTSDPNKLDTALDGITDGLDKTAILAMLR